MTVIVLFIDFSCTMTFNFPDCYFQSKRKNLTYYLYDLLSFIKIGLNSFAT